VHDAESSTIIIDLGAGLAQVGDCLPSHSVCFAGSLEVAEAIGTGLSGDPRSKTNNKSDSIVVGHPL